MRYDRHHRQEVTEATEVIDFAVKVPGTHGITIVSVVCPGATSVWTPSTLSWKPRVRSSLLNAILHGLDFHKLEPSMPFTFPFLNLTQLSNLC
jgi:hypothetical protein